MTTKFIILFSFSLCTTVFASAQPYHYYMKFNISFSENFIDTTLTDTTLTDTLHPPKPEEHVVASQIIRLNITDLDTFNAHSYDYIRMIEDSEYDFFIEIFSATQNGYVKYCNQWKYGPYDQTGEYREKYSKSYSILPPNNSYTFYTSLPVSGLDQFPGEYTVRVVMKYRLKEGWGYYMQFSENNLKVIVLDK